MLILLDIIEAQYLLIFGVIETNFLGFATRNQSRKAARTDLK